MPLKINQALIDELIKRRMDEDEMKERFAPRPDDSSVPEQTTLTPKQALLLGGLADAASTYTFLKKGSGSEDNKMLAFTKNKPLPTAMGAAGATMGALLLHKLLSKAHPQLADALAGGLGGYQTLLAAGNLDLDPQTPAGIGPPLSSASKANRLLADVVTGNHDDATRNMRELELRRRRPPFRF